MNNSNVVTLQSQIANMTPAEKLALIAALGGKPKSEPKAKFAPETLVWKLPQDSRERESAFKKIGWMKLPFTPDTTLADVEASVAEYNARPENAGKLEAWKQKLAERQAAARARREANNA